MAKKWLALLLVICMLLSSSITAIAGEMPEEAEESSATDLLESVQETETEELADIGEEILKEVEASSCDNVQLFSGKNDIFSDLTFLPATGCYSKITDVGGTTHTYAGCLDITSLETKACCEDIASYAIYSGTSLLLQIALHDIHQESSHPATNNDSQRTANGYYSASFSVSDTEEAFLTGLTADNVENIQKAILDAGLKKEYVSFKNLDFIDAEKNGFHYNLENEGDTDAELCWAGAAANILHYTGWGEQAGFATEDYLYDIFCTSFSDEGGRTELGIEWFFNGIYGAQGLSGYAQVDDESYGVFKGYFPDIPCETVCSTIKVRNQKDNILAVTDLLEQEYGVEMGISFIENSSGEREGGHAISLWGYVKNKTDAYDYSYLIVSDSDSDKYGYDNRRSAPNTLQALPISLCSSWNEWSWQINDYAYESETVIIDDFAVLAPYSNSIAEETEGDGDRFSYPDLTVSSIGIDHVLTYSGTCQSVLPEGVDIYVDPVFNNASAVVAPTFDYRMELKKEDTLVRTVDTTFPWGGLNPYCETEWAMEPVCIGALTAGNYSLTVTVNPKNTEDPNYPERTFTEANYLNNTKTIYFEVAATTAGSLQVSLGNMGRLDGDIGAYAQLTKPAEGVYYYIYVSYGDNSAKTEWELQYQGSAFPTQLFTYRCVDCENVFYRVLVKTAAGNNEYLEYTSGAIAQKYRYIVPYASSSNIYKLTSRCQTDDGYFASEQTVFNIVNASTVDDDVDVEWYLCAYRENALEASACLAYDTIQLPKGHEYEEPRTNHSLRIEKSENLTPGVYDLYVEAQYQDLLGNDEVTQTYVGSIVITSASPLPQVTTMDVQYYDNFSAYFSVDALVDLETEVRLGIEYSKSDTLSESITQWCTDDYCSYEYMNVSDETLIENLFPNTTYYYRSVLQVSGGEPIYGEIKSFQTAVTDADELVLDALQQVQLDGINDTGTSNHSFIFTPSSSGWYNFTVNGGLAGDCRLSYFEEGDCEQSCLYSFQGKINSNVYLTEGVRYCLYLVAYENATYQVKICCSKTSVTSYSVSAPALTENGSFAFIADVSAEVPRGKSFLLGIEIGENMSELTRVSEKYTTYSEEYVESSFAISCKPNRTYYFRSFVEDIDSGETEYSEFSDVVVPSNNAEALLSGEHILNLKQNQVYYLNSFFASVAGTCTITVSGPDGLLSYWSDSEGWSRQQFSLNGFSLTASLNAGECAYCKIMGYEEGIYRLSYTFEPEITTGTMTISYPGYASKTVSAEADSESMKLLRIGDVDGSGYKIGEGNTVTDMQCLFEYLSTGTCSCSIAGTDYFNEVADVNGDDTINILDYQSLYEEVRQNQ